MDEAPLTANDLPPGTLAAFAALRERFASGLIDRWREIEGLHGATPALTLALHRLAGAAGSFGFDDLGRAARGVELACGTGPKAAWWPAYCALYDQVLAVVPATHREQLSPPRDAPDTMW